jgi:hypothetical protein
MGPDGNEEEEQEKKKRLTIVSQLSEINFLRASQARESFGCFSGARVWV